LRLPLRGTTRIRRRNKPERGDIIRVLLTLANPDRFGCWRRDQFRQAIRNHRLRPSGLPTAAAAVPIVRRKALRVGTRDLHVQAALRVFVDVTRRRRASCWPAAGVGIPLGAGAAERDVVEAFKAAAAVSSRRFLFFRGRRRRLLWRWWRGRQGRIG